MSEDGQSTQSPPIRLVDKFYRGLLRITNPVRVPVGNWRLRRRALSSRADLRAEVRSAIDRGIAFFQSQPRLEMAALYVLSRLFESGLEPRLDFVQARLREYRDQCEDPHLRLVDREFDPRDRASATWVQTWPENPIEALMVKCLYADRLGLDEELLGELAAIDDGGGYGSTHVVLGGLLLKEFSHIPHARIDPLIASAATTLVRAQRTSLAQDLFFERIVFLQWIELHDEIEPAWILRTVRNQNSDGGWAKQISLGRGRSSQHASCLALAALIQYRSHRGGQGW